MKKILLVSLMVDIAVTSQDDKLCVEYSPASDMFCAVNADTGRLNRLP